MDWIELISVLIKNLSILLAMCVAIYGINSWRREHVGKRQVELAEDALALFYSAADAIKHMRNPGGFLSETDDIKKNADETDSDYRARKNASVVFCRYTEHQDIFNKLHAMRYRFMAQIGKQKAKPFDDLRKIVNKIIASARMLAYLWSKQSKDFQTVEDWKSCLQQVKEHEAVFWEDLEEEDQINSKLDAVLSEIEATCKSVISGKGN